jgi:lambda family phage portal protein
MTIAARLRNALAGLAGRTPLLALRSASYAAARQPPGRAPWTPPRGGPNAAIASAGQTVAARARDAVRNNAYAARVVDLWAANLVGTGITTQWPGAPHRAMWAAWSQSTECDNEGMTDWPGLQALAVRAMVESGEAILWLRRVPATPDNPVGLRIQVMEGDRLDWSHTRQLADGAIIQGIETDGFGRPIAYHLLPQLDEWPTWRRPSAERVRVPAADVIHLFRRRRPGQLRDVSWLAPILWTLRDLAEYDTALLRKAYVEACLALVVTGGDDDSTLTADSKADVLTDAQGRLVEAIEPQQILYGRGDRQIETIAPTGGGSHAGFAARALEAVAVGTGLSYDQVSGDLTRANYSSLRAGKIEFRRLLEQIQYTLLIPLMIGRVTRRFHAEGARRGLWPEPMPRVINTPPAPEMVDPLKDTLALIRQVRAGFVPQQEAVAQFGYDFGEVMRQIAEANAAADDGGVILDTDPRRTALGGSAQDQAVNSAIEIAATGAAGDGGGARQ